MNFEQLNTLSFDDLVSTADWTKMLKDLIGLAQTDATDSERGLMADKLDEFADKLHSDDLVVVTKLDQIARQTARSIRLDDAAQRVKALQATASSFLEVVKVLNAASAAQRKEAASLRAEKLNAAITSLSDAIGSLKNLAQTVDGADADLVQAIGQTMVSAQALRARLEQPQ